MEHFFRIAFWIFTLSSCLQANPIPNIVDLDIPAIEKSVSCGNAMFYTPTNVKVQCITTALDCFVEELKTVKQECDGDNYLRIDQATDFLNGVINQRLLRDHGLTNSTECACETSSQRVFKTFLRKMRSLVELHNSIILPGQ